MGRTLALLGICALAWGAAGCGGGEPADVEALLRLEEGTRPEATTPALVLPALTGRASAGAPPLEEAPPTPDAPPSATLDHHDRVVIPAGAAWRSVEPAIHKAAGRLNARMNLAAHAPVEVELNGGNASVRVNWDRDPNAAGLHLLLGAEPARMTVTAQGTDWIAAHGCDATRKWSAEAWSLELWQEALDRLLALPVEGKRSVIVRVQDDVPAETALRFITAVGDAHLGPAILDEVSQRRFRDYVGASGSWLARHQAPTGAWDDDVALGLCDGRRLRHAAMRGNPDTAENAGLTGLSLCAFLGAGYTHRGNHAYKAVVRRGLRHLRDVQRPDGLFPAARGWDGAASHALASLAMLEAYAMTESPILKRPAQRALDALPAAYRGTRDDWMATALTTMALRSAELSNEDAVKRGKDAPLTIDPTLRDLLLRDVRGVAIQAGDLPAAAALLTRILLERDAVRDAAVRAGAVRLAEALQGPDARIEPAQLWFATLVCYTLGRKPWKIMKGVLEKRAIDTQRKDGHTCCLRGSWDPAEHAQIPGGRVAATAVHAICLQVLYRYDRVLGIR